MVAWYNEIDPKAAAWLRELIKAGHIADGEVDERDIRDISPADLHGFAQCHFFAGIGVWSYALRRAGWSDDRPVWTGSCPCQPFSAAGKGAGFDDERHLWPSWFWLIEQCGPAVVFGEQVASKDAEPWLDLVQDDLEAVGYGVGAIPFPSAGVGAPHIRDRLYWVADAVCHGAGPATRDGDHAQGTVDGFDGSAAWTGVAPGLRRTPDLVGDAFGSRLEGHGRDGDDLDRSKRVGEDAARPTAEAGAVGRMADTDGGNASAERQQRGWEQRQQPQDGGAGELADAGSSGRVGGQGLPAGCEHDRPHAGRLEDHDGPLGIGEARDERGAAGPTNGLWRAADWLLCRDGKWRPVEPGTFPLAHGAPARVGRLRGYGNAINSEAARVWIESYLDTRTIEMA